MKLLLLFCLFTLALGDPTYAPQQLTEVQDAPQQVAPESQSQPVESSVEDKRLGKRSYSLGWNPWSIGGYGHGWPVYGLGHGWYGGYYPILPWYYGYGHGYVGYRGWPWYKKW